MTFDPTTNRIEFQLLTEEEKQVLMAWPHGWKGHAAGVWYDVENPNWEGYTVYRGKPAPVVEGEFINIYTGMEGGLCISKALTDAYYADRIATIRVDTINGKRIYTEVRL